MIKRTGIYKQAKQICSPYFNERPVGLEVSLLVIHCISLPEGVYGGKQIEQLFTGCLDCHEHQSFSDLQGLEVSAHCVIRRDGLVEQYVPFDHRAWHAGVSSFDGVEACNDYSIGIELEGTDKSAYTQGQYLALAELSQQLISYYPKLTKQRIIGHSGIAPGRKNDPGYLFDWAHYLALLD
ncbi:1,6-anhydro-N-acetylmuramyl-L-alanine amidase AmpD [Psychromonas sp. Urea-02u-13]|uniref:1,6-anhydro-N-acetylmuramyl-L-alanine amidase AmpD n=1 Tax=Psychromonas sp. Urea-02u-13 TaxID=2058326 RepID=UPI000C331881|nr:1,6-anhydro-N-acetylmuramyl-L-alanine amidase AmpD [Psychromonas sp. Urea-02u-13]PKG39770.1 1,6-anhydro-N-acetylmuramyl-L-alanine amidase AmpD [Psychromonas sp. Urea-02u-13]